MSVTLMKNGALLDRDFPLLKWDTGWKKIITGFAEEL